MNDTGKKMLLRAKDGKFAVIGSSFCNKVVLKNDFATSKSAVEYAVDVLKGKIHFSSDISEEVKDFFEIEVIDDKGEFFCRFERSRDSFFVNVERLIRFEDIKIFTNN